MSDDKVIAFKKSASRQLNEMLAMRIEGVPAQLNVPDDDPGNPNAPRSPEQPLKPPASPAASLE